MDVLTIVECVTAIATAIMAALLIWDRIEKMRYPAPIIELTSTRFAGPVKRHFDLTLVVRNRAPSALRFGAVTVEFPLTGTITFDGVKGRTLLLQVDIEPLQSHAFSLAFDAGETTQESLDVPLVLRCVWALTIAQTQLSNSLAIRRRL